MGPVAFWVISSACDNDFRLCFYCPQKTFHVGTGRMVGAGKPKVREHAERGHRWVSQGERKSRRLEERADPEVKVVGGTESWAKQAKIPKTQVGTEPLPLPTTSCPREMHPGQQSGWHPAPSSTSLVGVPFAQGPSRPPGQPCDSLGTPGLLN